MEATVRITTFGLGLAALLGCGTLVAGAGPAMVAAAASPACSVAYQVNSDWGTGFTVQLTVTNNGPAVTSWVLQYAYAGNQQLQNGWNGTWSQSGQTVTVNSASWNGSLPTGAAATAGANFSYTGTNTAPVAFTLNGVACNGGTGTTGAPPAVSITSPAPGTEVPSGSAITVSASASPGGSGTVTSVTFYAADYCTHTATDLGSATAAPYSVQWADLPVGYFGVSAVVTTSQNVSIMSAAVGLTTTEDGVPLPLCPIPAGQPAIAVVAPQAGSTVNSDITVPVSAVTSVGSAGSISSVTFYAVDTCGQTTTIELGTVTAAPYTYEWVQPTPGIYTITAVAVDAGLSLTSASVQIDAGPNGIPPPCPTPPPSG